MAQLETIKRVIIFMVSFIFRAGIKLIIVMLLLSAILSPALTTSFANPVSTNPQDLANLLYSRLLSPIADFIDRKIDLVATWPVAIVIVAIAALNKANLLTGFNNVFGRIRSVEAFGLNLELEQQFTAFTREGEEIKELIPRLRSNIAKELALQVERTSLNKAFSDLVISTVARLSEKNTSISKPKIRATIHVQDPLFEDQLMQLLEYHNGEGKLIPGENAGRSFSMRRGIVGRCWRSLLPETRNLLTDEEKSEETNKDKIIAQTWGLTLEEADKVKEYPSYIGIPFQRRNVKFVLYLDSRLDKAFGTIDQNSLVEYVKEEMEDTGIADTVVQISKKLTGPRLRIES